MAADKDTFKKVTSVVIDKIEGGYFNPQWHSTSGMGPSGETMFGIDRKFGGKINDSIAGKSFWNIIDTNKSKDVWVWNYKGGKLNDQLKNLTIDAIYPFYVKNSNSYLSDKAAEIVDKDGRLLFHFIYATWNGPGWFRKFAQDINEAVDKGVTDPNKLVQVAIDSRTKEGLKKGSAPNLTLKKSGLKIASFIEELKQYSTNANPIFKKKNNSSTVIIVALTIIAGYILYSTLKNKNR